MLDGFPAEADKTDRGPGRVRPQMELQGAMGSICGNDGLAHGNDDVAQITQRESEAAGRYRAFVLGTPAWRLGQIETESQLVVWQENGPPGDALF